VSCDTLAAVYHDFYAVQLAEVAPAAANINYAMGGFMRRMRTDKQAVSSISRQIVEFTNDAQRTMPKLQQLAKDPELRAALGQLSSNLAFIEGALAKYR
jgi:conjugal transfer/entry exclusion protein